MTKVRPPLSYDLALAKIALLLGWEEMGKIVNRKDRTVRNWSDPDAPESCPIECAELLDLAYAAAGGDGSPMFECFSLRLEAARAERFSDEAAIARKAIHVIKEGGEAHAALIRASLPGATEADRRDAAREVEEAASALTTTLPLLTKGAGPNGNIGEGRSGGSTQ